MCLAEGNVECRMYVHVRIYIYPSNEQRPEDKKIKNTILNIDLNPVPRVKVNDERLFPKRLISERQYQRQSYSPTTVS